MSSAAVRACPCRAPLSSTSGLTYRGHTAQHWGSGHTLNTSFPACTYLTGGCKSLKTRYRTSLPTQQHKKLSEVCLICYFYPMHKWERWASKLWEGCGNVERVNCLGFNQQQQELHHLYPHFQKHGLTTEVWILCSRLGLVDLWTQKHYSLFSTQKIMPWKSCWGDRCDRNTSAARLKKFLNIYFKNPFPLFSFETFLGVFISSNIRDENQKETRKIGVGATQSQAGSYLAAQKMASPFPLAFSLYFSFPYLFQEFPSIRSHRALAKAADCI